MSDGLKKKRTAVRRHLKFPRFPISGGDRGSGWGLWMEMETAMEMEIWGI